MSDVAYPVTDWEDAREVAERYEFCPTDSREDGNSPLAQWLCDEVIKHEKVGNNPEIIEAAILLLDGRGEKQFSPDRFLTVIASYSGDSVDNWEEFAKEYAATDYPGDDNPEDTNWAGFTKLDHYKQWVMRYAVREDEVYTSVSSGETMYWFDAAKW